MEMLINVLNATLRLSTPLVLAALGGVLSQQVNQINIALEGLMLFGAFTAVIATYLTGSVWVGALAAVVISSIIAAVFAFFVLQYKANLIVAGLAVNILALGGTTYLLQILFHTRGSFSPKNLPGFPVVHIPLLEQIPLIGPVVSGQGVLVYVAWILAVLVHLFVYRTVPGLHFRAVGERREAAKSVGISAVGVEYAALIASGAFSGLAGAQLSLGNVQLFTENMTQGRGFMALAAVYFGQAQPIATSLSCLLFGFFDALQIRLQTTLGIPPQWPQMLPFVIIVLALTVIALRQKMRIGAKGRSDA